MTNVNKELCPYLQMLQKIGNIPWICFQIYLFQNIHKSQPTRLFNLAFSKKIQLLDSAHGKKHCSKTLYENPLLIPFMFSRHMWKTLKTPFFIPTLFANLFKCTYHRRFNRAYLVFSSHSTSQSMYIFEARNMQYREMRKLMNIYKSIQIYHIHCVKHI